MKKTIVFFMLFTIILLLSGCVENKIQPTENKEGTIMENQKTITMEYILENSDLTMADFDGIDFDDFVARYKLTEDNINDYYLPDLIKTYRKIKTDVYVQYSDIYENANEKLQTDDLKNIQILLWEYHNGNKNSYMVVDYEKKGVFFSSMNIIEKCRESDKIAELTQEDIQFIESVLNDSNIIEWENKYIGNNDGIEGNFAWSVGFKLANGSCVTYSGHGVQNSNTPIELKTLITTLKDRFVES